MGFLIRRRTGRRSWRSGAGLAAETTGEHRYPIAKLALYSRLPVPALLVFWLWGYPRRARDDVGTAPAAIVFVSAVEEHRRSSAERLVFLSSFSHLRPGSLVEEAPRGD